MFDMHTHTHNSHDGSGFAVDSAKSAKTKGISAIAVTDHCDIQYYIEHNVKKRIANSLKEAEKVNKLSSGTPEVLKGIEIGESIFNMEYTNDILLNHNYDVIIGSVHEVKHKKSDRPYSLIDFSDFSSEELNEFMHTYFDDVFTTLTTLPCDIMAHLTCPLRYINGKYNRSISSRDYEEQITKILEYIIKNSIAMEINTSGIGTAFNTLMPDEWIIKKYYEMGGYLITLGSDAHISENIGNGFNEAIAFLKETGFKKCYYYKNRKAIAYDL
ncbi:MAG: histidinol-phosphatase HisJ family protein [Clostridia bacterium]|nr:histidinol-phosphatase HisJ family protein [Clostridia bacterium]